MPDVTRSEASAGKEGWRSRRRLVPLLLSLAVIMGMVASCLLILDLRAAVWRALPALPGAVAIHVVQLFGAAMAWRGLFHAPLPGPWLMLRARWIRESLNGLLPMVGIGGGVLAAAAIARQTGRPFAGTAAGATADLAVETVAQLPFLVLGLVLFSLLAPEALPLAHAAVLLMPIALATLVFVGLWRGIGRALILQALGRIGLAGRIEALRGSLDVINGGARPVLAGVAWHFLAWALGAVEIWLIFAVLGVPVSLAEAYVIEALGMGARSLGFLVPAGLGAQEAGLVAVSVALGVPLEQSIAMSMLKRLREVVMGVPGLLAWRWLEQRSGEAAGPRAS